MPEAEQVVCQGEELSHAFITALHKVLLHCEKRYVPCLAPADCIGINARAQHLKILNVTHQLLIFIHLFQLLLRDTREDRLECLKRVTHFLERNAQPVNRFWVFRIDVRPPVHDPCKCNGRSSNNRCKSNIVGGRCPKERTELFPGRPDVLLHAFGRHPRDVLAYVFDQSALSKEQDRVERLKGRVRRQHLLDGEQLDLDIAQGIESFQTVFELCANRLQSAVGQHGVDQIDRGYQSPGRNAEIVDRLLRWILPGPPQDLYVATTAFRE